MHGVISETELRDSGKASVRGSSVMLRKIVSSRLGLILAAISGINGDSEQNIPARQRGQLA